MYAALASTFTGAMPGLGNILQQSMEFDPQRIARMRPREREWRRDVLGSVGPSGLTAAQREARGLLRGQLGLSNLQREERDVLRGFTQGAPGQSVATQAAMDAFRTQQLPQILQGSAVSGLGQGAIAEAAAQAAQQAYVPLAQQDIQNRMAAAQGLGALGQQAIQNRMAAAQGLGNLGAQGYAQNVGLQGIVGMPRDIRNMAGQAGYNEQLRLQELASSFLLGPFGQLARPGSSQHTVNTGGGK